MAKPPKQPDPDGAADGTSKPAARSQRTRNRKSTEPSTDTEHQPAPVTPSPELKEGTPRPDLRPEEQAPASEEDLDDIPRMPAPMIEAWHDGKSEERKENPSVRTRFKSGVSGNPSGYSNGRRRAKEQPAGNVLANIGHEVLDELKTLMLLDVVDLQVRADDRVTTAVAKTLLGDALKKDGVARKFVVAQFLEKPLQSDRATAKDPREEEGRIMQKMIHAMADPGMTEDDMQALVDSADQHHETYGEFGARRRKERKKRRKRRPKS